MDAGEGNVRGGRIALRPLTRALSGVPSRASGANAPLQQLRNLGPALAAGAPAISRATPTLSKKSAARARAGAAARSMRSAATGCTGHWRLSRWHAGDGPRWRELAVAAVL